MTNSIGPAITSFAGRAACRWSGIGLSWTQQLEHPALANCQRPRAASFYSTQMNAAIKLAHTLIGQPIPPELPPVPGQSPEEPEPGTPPRPHEPLPFEPAPPDPEPSTVTAPKA